MKVSPEHETKKPLYPVLAIAAATAAMSLSSCDQQQMGQYPPPGGDFTRLPITTGGK